MNFVHGHASSTGKSPTYRTWKAMMGRCFREGDANWHRYGGRGITACERWRTFANFLADMGERPKGLTLDRIDNDGNYEPDNCRWATRMQQGRNNSRNRLVTLNGETRCISEWCEVLGLNHHTIAWRLHSGMTAEEALKKPIKRHNQSPPMD